MTTDHTARLAQSVRHCMTDTFITLPQEATLRDAARALRDRDIGLLLVTSGDLLVGLVSERDIVTAMADGDAPDEVLLADRARVEIVTIDADDSVQAGIDRMSGASIRHLVVVDPTDRQPVGIMSARDVLLELTRL